MSMEVVPWIDQVAPKVDYDSSFSTATWPFDPKASTFCCFAQANETLTIRMTKASSLILLNFSNLTLIVHFAFASQSWKGHSTMLA